MFDENPTPDAGASIESNDTPELSGNEAPVETSEQPGETQPEPKNEGATPEIPLSDIASLLDVDENDLDVDEDGKVVLKAKIDGKEERKRLSEVRKTYQKSGHLDNETRRVKQTETELQARQTQLNEQAKAFEAHGQLALNRLQQQYNQVNWQELRETDEARYVLMQRDFETEANRIKTEIGQAKQYISNVKKQEIAKQYDALSKVIPEWSDPAVMESEKQMILDYAASNDINPEVMNYAHGISALRKAALYDKAQSDKAEVVKLVRDAPKVSKPGNSNPKPKPKSDADLFYS